MKNHFHIEPLSSSHIPKLVESFHLANWSKPMSLFKSYLKEQTENERLIWVALSENHIAGYITLKWHSAYPAFQKQNIPEIMDFNVLPNFRNQGIGSALLAVAEHHAFAKNETIGLGVGLYADYGQALKLYVKYGYKPDGKGITSHYQTVAPGTSICLDDDLVLWFTKTRAKPNQYNLISKQNAMHYTWGGICDGWWLHQTDKLTVILERMPPHTSEQKHYHHQTEQFFYCLEGELCIETNEGSYKLNANEGFSVFAGIAHQVINQSSSDVTFLVISCPNSHHDRVNL